MIVICEPQCKYFAHEKVNSGFLYMASLAYPEDKILFFAHETHITSIKNILSHDNILIQNIEYIPIKFHTSFNTLGLFQYEFLLKKIFKICRQNQIDKILFLSISAPILSVIKKLKKKSVYEVLKFSFVLHADFENIVDHSILKKDISILPVDFKNKIHKLKIKDFPRFILSQIRAFLIRIREINRKKFSKKFPIKQALLHNHNSDFRYIALAPYIVQNSEKYEHIHKLQIRTVFFPTVFSNLIKKPDNIYPKFAVFGYGNNIVLKEVLDVLIKKNPLKKFEVRIIGMDTAGLDKYDMVSCPSQGRALTRVLMEKYSTDIDFFLILYTKSKYRLSCSGSIIESFSYMKPIIHLENECIDFFNNKELPIGFSCNNINEYALIMGDIINNFEKYNDIINAFRNNISINRSKYKIENSVNNFKKSFEWTN